MSKNRFWLLLIILMAFALRLTLLDKQSLWYDEAVTWMLSRMSLAGLIQWTATDIQPPLYYLLIWTSGSFIGDSEWALRFPSALFNTLTVPLIYLLALRLYKGGALLPALIFALSPLMVYYSQEARMYALLIFEVTLLSYILLKIQCRQPTNSLLIVPYSSLYLYVLVAVATLYTHYFAVFMLAVHILYSIFILWQKRWSKIILWQSLFIFGVSLLFFAPWLPTLFSRFGDDPSYWAGRLKLNEALRKALINFAVGETVIEQTGFWIALVFIIFLLIGLIFWSVQAVRKRQTNSINSAIFLLLWLFLPIVFVLLLSYRSPKFNPRYVILSWPAFALIIGFGLRNSRFMAQRILTILALLFIFSAYSFSLYNWFEEPRFSKSDFRALAQFVQERATTDETVLLSSGHFFPVWAYYYGWDGWTSLPNIQRLDVNRITDLSISADIAPAIKGKKGVWLVTWQDEVIDPNGLIPFWLDLIGQRPIDGGDFWGVGLEHWRLKREATDLLTVSPIKKTASFNFAGQVKLLGYTQLSDNDVALFWQPLQPLPDNLILTLDLTDNDGFSWDKKTGTGSQPGAYSYPPSRWPLNQTVMTRHKLPWQVGTPPGLYTLKLGLGQSTNKGFNGWDILDEQGRPARRTALLENINLSRLIYPPGGSLPIEPEPEADLFPIIGLRRTILPYSKAEPGDRILLVLIWQAGQFNSDNVSVAFDLVDSNGQTFRVGSSLTPSRNFNLPRWKPGDVVLGQYWLDIPPQALPGRADIQLHIKNEGVYNYDELFSIAELEILATERNFITPSEVDMPLKADFSGQATLIGADCSPSNCQAVQGEELISFTLYWRGGIGINKNYTIFTHLLGADGTVIINADHAPVRSTRGWVNGEIIADSVSLTIPTDLPAGEYPVEVGLYDASDPAFYRLPLMDGQTRLILPKMVVVAK